MIRVRPWAVAMAFAVANGCATMSDVFDAHRNGEGTKAVYVADEDQIWTAARDVLHEEGADSVEEHKPESYMLASFNQTVFGAWIEPMDETHVQVTAISKRRDPTAVTINLTETTFLQEVGEFAARKRKSK